MPKIEESDEATMRLKEEEFGEKKEMHVPTVHWDDRFACDEREGETLALFVLREMASKAMQSTFFPVKMDSILFMSYVDVLWSRNWMVNHWSSWVVANKECWRAMLGFGARQKQKEATSKSWCKKFDVLRPLESEEEIKEVNNIANVHEIVDISVGGAAKGVRPICNNGVFRPLSLRTKTLAASIGSFIRFQGGSRLEFGRYGTRCNMKFLDADIWNLLALAISMIDEGVTVVCDLKSRG